MRILKLGGSLLEWPDCGNTLRDWLRSEPPMENVLILGGGRAAAGVRQRSGRMTEEAAHWAAIRCMEKNARQFACDQALATVSNVGVARDGLPRSSIVVLTDIETHVRGSDLPKNWSVTSDSIAAEWAATHAAAELVLLKSCDAWGRTALELCAAGVVDDYFPSIADQIAFRVVNLRNVGIAREHR